MVSEENIDLLLTLAKDPARGRPMDFQVFATLLDSYPDFDLLRKVFIEQGIRFGAKGPHFLKEQEIWKKKQRILEPDPQHPTRNYDEDIDILPFNDKIKFFLDSFSAINKPLKATK
jgi:hypothetical protein